MRATRSLSWVLGCALVAGCAPTGQVLLYIDTDAPVPPDPADSDGAPVPPLFDTVRVELLQNGQPFPDGATPADFPVDAEKFRAHRVSLGIAPPIQEDGLAARVQLFRKDRLRDGRPPTWALLSKAVRLPPIGSDEELVLTVVLRAGDVGQRLGEPDPVDADPGPPSESLVGSWPAAVPVPCAQPPRSGEACVPGGAYWFGDPLMRITLEGTALEEERLVVVSPFFIDLHEVTVGEFRARWPTLGGTWGPNERDPSQDPRSLLSWCTWTAEPQGLEDLPMNCLAADTAERYCAALGKQLPSEAQFEFVATGRGQEWGYPWGDDEPQCGDAVWGRGQGGGPQSVIALDSTGPCRPSAQLGGPLPAGSGVLDRVPLPDGEIVDLAGNLSEWGRDRYSDLGDPFWTHVGVLVDPVFPASSSTDDRVARSGYWMVGPYQIRPSSRMETAFDNTSIAIGFRCARAASP